MTNFTETLNWGIEHDAQDRNETLDFLCREVLKIKVDSDVLLNAFGLELRGDLAIIYSPA